MQLLHNVCCIGESLIMLQQAGNVRYIGWKLTVQSLSTLSISVLKELASCLQDELRVWDEEVCSVREEFYELNYYTTLQLLKLRKQLAAQKSQNIHSVVADDILTLLESVSRNVTSDILCSTLTELKMPERIIYLTKEQIVINNWVDANKDRNAALDISIWCDQDAANKHIKIEELGVLLRKLSQRVKRKMWCTIAYNVHIR